MTELTVEQRLDRIEYYTKVECSHCKQPTPLVYAERLNSKTFGHLFQGLFCYKCLEEYKELEDKLREDMVTNLAKWYKPTEV